MNHISPERRLLLTAAGAILVGFFGFMIVGHGTEGYVFAHVGGVGLLSLFGSLSGYLAKKKGYNFGRAYVLGFVFPVIIGIIAVVVVHLTGGSGCGGIISLALALAAVAIYSLLRSRKANM
jgi:FtsH-binding integral membrane protein